MSELTKQELSTLAMISKITEVLEKLQDNKTIKSLKESGAEKFKEADALVEQNQAILNHIRDENAVTSHKVKELQGLEEKTNDLLDKVKVGQKTLDDREASLKEAMGEFQADMKEREREISKTKKNLEIREAEAEDLIEKYEALVAEYNEKLEKIKSLAA